jgi:trimeric autotransporter adhesin
MRRFLTLVFMLCLAVPAGITLSGCTRNPAGNYCYGLAYGVRNTEVASIVLQPQTTGISLAYGQTQQIQAPAALTCTGASADVGGNSFTYGTTNNKLVDISPNGNICAGTWNRNTGGGIPDYTYCNFPNPLPATNSLPYSSAFITASANSVTSNPVQVFVHAQVSSISLVGPQQCLSQTQTAPLDSQACYSVNGQQYLMCKPTTLTDSSKFACPLAPGVTSVPSCSSAVGFLNYTVGTATVATINSANNQITATAPGTTAINASVAGSGSSAGYFSTCPPKSINLTLSDGSTSGIITRGVQQNLITTVVDTNNQTITGLNLDYQSTNPIDITVGVTGGVLPRYPGVASVYAVCQPASCNPTPINVFGLNGTGLSITSNAVNITTPGTISDYVWFAAPGKSQYVVPIELLTGTLGSTVRLPYVPNSMVMDQTGSSLYFGSQHELMIYSALNNTLVKEETSVPGVILTVSPNNAHVIVNDQVREVFYVYNTASGSSTSFGGLGNAAAYTPDSKTLYITDNAALGGDHKDMLYVYNVSTGWSTYPLPPSPLPSASIPSSAYLPNIAISPTIQTPALTIPSVGAYLRGTPTVAHTWCPLGTASSSGSSISAFYPGPFPGSVATQGGDSQPVQSDVLTATTDGKHILSAAMVGGGITLSDINVAIPAGACPGATTSQLSPLTIGHAATPYTQAALTVNASNVNQIIASPVSNLAFVLYNGSSANAQLPYYVPSSTGAAGKLGYITLAGSSSITAPVAGAFTPDDSIFFVSTAGDNKVHFLSIPTDPSTTAPTDSQQISPNLPACTPVSAGGQDAGCTFTGSGTVAPATAIAVAPRSTT